MHVGKERTHFNTSQLLIQNGIQSGTIKRLYGSGYRHGQERCVVRSLFEEGCSQTVGVVSDLEGQAEISVSFSRIYCEFYEKIQGSLRG